MNRPEWLPNHPKHEGAVFAFFVLVMTSYAMIAIYVFGRAAVG